uniref:Odorant receptor 43 n=1 Tax=Conogethes punctiferalis TaxID=1133088 RepID=A0A1Y9TJT3_CONPF|nr:odorant receptor 43 [Conogethes punctiferalis]
MDVPTFEELFRQLKFNMWLFGILFDDYEIAFRFYCFVLSMFSMLVEETSFFISRYAPENFLELTQLAPCLGIALLSVLKILPIAAKRQKISVLTKSLNKLYNAILMDPEKREVVKKEILLVHTIIKYFFILNTILITVYNFAPLAFMLYAYLKHNRIEYKVPYAVSLPFALDSYPKWFIVYFHSIISGFVCILFVTSVDALYCMLTSQICSNFTVISNEILHLDESGVHRLKDLIIYHQQVLKLSDDLEEIFKLVNLFNVVVGSTEICALGFNITTGDLGHLPGYILFLSSVLLQILLMSVFGEKLIREVISISVFKTREHNILSY